MAFHGGLRPYCATFLVFSDYLRPALRVSAIAKLPVVYVLTHDSIFVGEDGPTHEPVEHLAALRAIPNLRVLRPGDPEETNEAWRRACERTDGPTALILSRQALPTLKKRDAAWKSSFDRGAYVVRDCAGAPEIVVVATGSEVHLAVSAAEDLPGRRIRVVSMPCREDFLRQDRTWRESLIPPSARKLVIEAGSDLGWAGPFDDSVATVTISTFGESGPADKLAEHFGFTRKAVAERLAAM
jgi:transketolase